MKRNYCLSLVLLALFGMSAPYAANAAVEGVPSSQSTQQAKKITGKVTDAAGEPIIGASVLVKERGTGAVTDIDGKFSVEASAGNTLMISFIGYRTMEIKVAAASTYIVTLQDDSQALDEVVVTAMGIKKDRKALGYAIDEMRADELMKNKSANPLTSLSGKIPGVNITQSSGAAGSGAQIILRGATSVSEDRDSQPLFVVDGVIYDNSSSVGGNSAFDGSTNTSTTTSNRVMDISPEDIESMSVLKGPAAAALYGSRAANGVVLITTKKGKTGRVEVNLAAKYITSWTIKTSEAQTRYRRGFMEDQFKDGVYQGAVYNDFSYNSWGDHMSAGEKTYDNIGNFFQNGGVWDTNLSVSGGNEKGNFYLSGSFFDQDGVVPNTGYTKSTFRFNGEQRWKMFTFGANASYSEARTAKTLTSGGLYGSSGDGAMSRLFGFGTTDDMSHYLNEDGTRYRMFGDRLDAASESDNPYWIINKTSVKDKTMRFTGNFNVKADITDWWWVSYRMGIDSYTTDYAKRLAAGGVMKLAWQDGMMSDNTTNYHYLSTNFLTNFNKQFGDFGFNLLLGTSTDKTTTKQDYRMAYGFEVDNFFSYDNAAENNKSFKYYTYEKRLVGVFGEFRADWKNMVFLTVTGRNDWTSTLAANNRSYFYPSVGGSVVFSQFLQDKGLLTDNSILSFGKVRASWAKVGKDTNPYGLTTALWPVHTYLGDKVGLGNSWTRGNKDLKPEMTESTEIGVELHFFKNRLKLDYAYYTNNSIDQIISPRGPQSTGYIFCSVNMGNVKNKGMELSISGTPIQTKNLEWETGINIAGNRGRLEGLATGMDVMYVTDVQYGYAKAASYSEGAFMGIAGTQWVRNDEGQVIIGKNGLPTKESNPTYMYLGNREPKFTGGWTNSLTWKNWSFNMLWEFRVGGYVYNGTQQMMDNCGTSQYTADMRDKGITISGVQLQNGSYVPVSYTYEWDKNYTIDGVEKSGATIIADYYQNYHHYEVANYLTKVNSLRLRQISLSYDIPKSILNKTNVFKRAVLSASATNLLLFTNYKGDPEAAASGAGVGGSSSVGFDYCGVPSTASFAFGVNLTF
ncbi:SusC/RagA family TonB-linked outer membrane protein [Bacteroides sp.]|uniref:SusC/RagA family TonB-linked outer membrane protein n=1 Tax=Bacteroides sp. TaxID=29523 RepID=UPI0023C7DFD4|nr:SusC/RagA family TonB-linked outer membrane protein [Bacteroides sp.]MDE6214832.1 SusC/RagA family TonB-linked outer membrane protein [Bacteroides sp.]